MISLDSLLSEIDNAKTEIDRIESRLSFAVLHGPAEDLAHYEGALVTARWWLQSLDRLGRFSGYGPEYEALKGQ